MSDVLPVELEVGEVVQVEDAVVQFGADATLVERQLWSVAQIAALWQSRP